MIAGKVASLFVSKGKGCKTNHFRNGKVSYGILVFWYFVILVFWYFGVLVFCYFVIMATGKAMKYFIVSSEEISGIFYMCLLSKSVAHTKQ